MKIAVLADAHGNYPALRAVLDDAARKGAKGIWYLGDFLGYGPFPNEVVRTLLAKAVCIVGNHDLKVLEFLRKQKRWRQSKDPRKFFSFEWTYRHLTPEVRRKLRALPQTLSIALNRRRFLLVHGSPAAIDETLEIGTSYERFAQLAGLAQADVILCGHTHNYFRKTVKGTMFINPGSVGRPFDGDPRASYALVEITDGRLKVLPRRIRYDIRRTTEKMKAERFPEDLIDSIRQGKDIDDVRPQQKEPGVKVDNFVGVDIGGTKIAVALVSGEGKILHREKSPTPREGGAKEIYHVVGKLIRKVMKRGRRIPSFAGIGVGVPGVVCSQTGKVLLTPNIPLSGFPLAKKLAKDFHSLVAVGNDVDLGLLGEQWLGAGRSAKSIIGIFPGTGIGGGIILHGNLWTGTKGAAAEIGHMVMDIDGPVCSCGNIGCLEALASRWAIERDIRRAVEKGEKTIVMELTNGNLRLIKSKIIKKALKLKDPVVTTVMKRAAIILGKACISIRHIFDPEMIVLGGGLMEACGPFILPVVQREVMSDPFFAPFKSCSIVASELGDKSVLLGAVALVKKERIKQKSKKNL